jgi:hypothetical protein
MQPKIFDRFDTLGFGTIQSVFFENGLGAMCPDRFRGTQLEKTMSRRGTIETRSSWDSSEYISVHLAQSQKCRTACEFLGCLPFG